jgi:hypothetical protein
MQCARSVFLYLRTSCEPHDVVVTSRCKTAVYVRGLDGCFRCTDILSIAGSAVPSIKRLTGAHTKAHASLLRSSFATFWEIMPLLNGTHYVLSVHDPFQAIQLEGLDEITPLSGATILRCGPHFPHLT